MIIFLKISTAASADLARKLVAIKKGDFDTALKEWLPLAEDGNPSAQYNIGQLYRIGRGVDRELHQGQPNGIRRQPNKDIAPRAMVKVMEIEGFMRILALVEGGLF